MKRFTTRAFALIMTIIAMFAQPIAMGEESNDFDPVIIQRMSIGEDWVDVDIGRSSISVLLMAEFSYAYDIDISSIDMFGDSYMGKYKDFYVCFFRYEKDGHRYLASVLYEPSITFAHYAICDATGLTAEKMEKIASETCDEAYKNDPEQMATAYETSKTLIEICKPIQFK